MTCPCCFQYGVAITQINNTGVVASSHGGDVHAGALIKPGPPGAETDPPPPSPRHMGRG